MKIFNRHKNLFWAAKLEFNELQDAIMMVTLYLIKLIDVRKNTNKHRILYKISSSLAIE